MGIARVAVLTGTAPVVWGTTYVVTSEMLPADHPLFAALLRALPAGLVALAITRTLPAGSWWWKSAVLGALNIGFFFPLLFLAAYRLPGGIAATLNATQPLVVAVVAAGIGVELFSRGRFYWGLVGVVGVALVVVTASASLDLVGVVAGTAGAASMALGVTLIKRWGRPSGVGPMAFAGWQLSAGGIILLPIMIALEDVPSSWTAESLVGYVWLGIVGGLFAYTVWFSGIGRMPVTSAAVLALLSPLTAAVLGVVVLGQLLGPWQIVGFTLALAAIVGAQLVPSSTPPSLPLNTPVREGKA